MNFSQNMWNLGLCICVPETYNQIKPKSVIDSSFAQAAFIEDHLADNDRDTVA